MITLPAFLSIGVIAIGGLAVLYGLASLLIRLGWFADAR